MTGVAATLAGRYTIERELGAGGMANVYLAHDVRHDRKVALKVLRPELAAVIGAARFLAEIRTTANLQHPHILPLYDSGEVDGTVFYVMPYVVGESLRDRLARESQLPVSEAIRIASETADALDYAHRHGVIHRDIKPENILLHDGRALVADFGIALAVSRSDSSTRMTETGMSLGTPHYMSPEQAMGERAITPRSDVYALGCVTYEMLTGEPPFTGPTAQAIVARVMMEAPRSLVAQRHTVPPHVEAAVHRALEKLPADRFDTAAEFGHALRTPGGLSSYALRDTSPGAYRVDRRAKLDMPLAVLLATALGVIAWTYLRPPAPKPVTRYAMYFAAEHTPDGPMRLSNRGNLFVYGGPGSFVKPAELWVKRRDQAQPTPIPGTLGSTTFAISPDEKSIAFIAVDPSNALAAMGTLRRMPIAGGPQITLADSVYLAGAAWLDDGTIVFGRRDSTGASLWRVPENGGKAERVWRADSAEFLALPSPVPNGGVLVTRHIGHGTAPEIWLIDTRTGTARFLIKDAVGAEYLPTGHVLYARRDGALLAIAFDVAKSRVSGAAVPVMDGVEVVYEVLPQFSVATDGTMIVRLRSSGAANRFNAVWMDRLGQATLIDSAWQFNPLVASGNAGWSLSPDGSRLAIGLVTNGNSDIWVKQLPSGPLTRVTFDSAPDVRPRWTPDGKALTYVFRRGNTEELRQINADGTGGDTALLRSATAALEGVRSHDDRWLLARIGDGALQSRDIVGVQAGSSELVKLVAAPNVDEAAVALSPDGKWLAYESNESGPPEVFIRPFPATSTAKWQVSTGGGFAPLWNPNGREIFYVTSKRQLVAVTLAGGSTPAFGERQTLFTLANDVYGGFPENYTSHDISRDGSRFLMVRRVQMDNGVPRVLVIENFFEELKTQGRAR
jgi:eukaryotic-like serine/threonine-protein kinase